ncbi:MAG: DUF4438 domain-containing protein [Candidatus Omnitrophota bacterium]
MKLRTNEDRLVRIAVQGKVANALQFSEFEVAHDGRPFAVPSSGGIVYNVKVGDSAFAWEGDHIEPAVSAVVHEEKRSSKPNMGFNFLACVGNRARIVSGEAKGDVGMVTGRHGGLEHVLIDFPDATLRKMNVGDNILIEGYGQGLKLTAHGNIRIYSLDPAVLAKMPVREVRGGLEVGVTAMIPAALMGSGLGHNNIGTGDLDFMTHDAREVAKLGLEKICLGDFVAILDHDHSFGRTYRRGAVTIGIVIHTDSLLPGHGPGVTTLMTSPEGALRPVIDPKANLGRILKIGRYRTPKRPAR